MPMFVVGFENVPHMEFGEMAIVRDHREAESQSSVLFARGHPDGNPCSQVQCRRQARCLPLPLLLLQSVVWHVRDSSQLERVLGSLVAVALRQVLAVVGWRRTHFCLMCLSCPLQFCGSLGTFTLLVR
ncbi:hypothetical protein AtEden1_Chr5g0112151 [Arabidopsis thaliana]